MMTAEELQRELLAYQQEQDYMKHLTTLNTGSILLIVTFLEKLFKHPEWNFLVGFSLVAFIVSILGCVTAHLLSVLDIDWQFTAKLKLSTRVLIIATFIMSYGGFLVGLISLTVFGLKNLY